MMERFGDIGLWAANEFGGADLGDIRRSQRLVAIAAGAASRVGAAMSSVCGKSGSQATSRLLGREETSLSKVIEPHIRRTSERCASESRIIAVQDTTSLDFTSHSSTSGLGPITTAQHSRGLLNHTVLAVGAGKVPLGLLGMQLWSRDESNRGCSKDRRRRQVSDKESNKWLVGLEQAQCATSADMRMLVVGDRESDVYALFVAPRRNGVDLLVRMAQDRALDDDEYRCVREALNDAAVVGTYRVEVPRQSSRPKRIAVLDLRITRVSIKRPATCGSEMPSSVEVSLIWAKERDALDGVVALDWVLLTTESVEDLESAVEMVKSYSTRWLIEEFHRVLKDGCRAERMQFDSVERITPALGILAVVAWRVLRLTKQSRSAPDADVSEVANAEEVSILNRWLQSQGEHKPISTVKAFTIAVARLGGFLGRKSDGMPGIKTIWQGLRSLEFLLLGHKLATQQEM
jgi:hypothetical protein